VIIEVVVVEKLCSFSSKLETGIAFALVIRISITSKKIIKQYWKYKHFKCTH